MSTSVNSFALALCMTALMAATTVAQDVAGPAGSNVFVKVTQNREISGALIDLTEIKVTTSFGEVAIPMSKVDGIKMHADANDSAVIAFKNGDLVTGKIAIDVVKLKTDWGTAHVNASQIETLTIDRNARFYSDNAGGAKSWRFTKAAPVSSAPRN